MRAVAALALLGCALAAHAEIPLRQNLSDEYDAYFAKYAKRYFGPGFDWRWFKAQAIAESNLNPRARSPTGALGLMQILPSTFAEIRAANPYYVDIHTPRWNIAAGIYYNYYLYRQPYWETIADQERLFMAFGGYNAGLGGVLRAWRRATPPIEAWADVAPYAPKETQYYVLRIGRIKTEALDLARP